jgi:protein-disulfide isomerase
MDFRINIQYQNFIHWTVRFFSIICSLLIFSNCQITDNKIEKLTKNEYDIVLGDLNAPISVIMFFDYNCSFCRNFFNNEYEEFKINYIDNNKTNLVLKLINLSEQPDLMKALQAAICINKIGNLTPYHNLLLYNNRVIYSEEFKELLDYYIGENTEIAECLLSDTSLQDILKNNATFKKLKLKGTPTFVINDRIYHGYKNYKDLNLILKNNSN